MTEQDLLFERDDVPYAESSQENSLDKPTAPNLKRSTPVTQRKVPPARPPPISPDKQRKASFPTNKPPLPPVKASPSRPPPPPNTKTKLLETSSTESTSDGMCFDTTLDKQNEVFIEPDSGNTSMLEDEGAKKRPILLPASPFYTPSSDLLDLDQSLFTETMKSLSEDTRSLITSSGSSTVSFTSPSIASSTNPFKPTDSGMEIKQQQRLSSLVFNDDFNNTTATDTSRESNLHRSPVLSSQVKTPSSAETCSSGTVDPFASCFEEAKKDFQLTNKR